MKEVEVFFQALVVWERDQVFPIKSSLGVTYLLNIPKLMMFMQSHWLMPPMIARKVLRGPKAKEDCRHEAAHKMLESDPTTISN